MSTPNTLFTSLLKFQKTVAPIFKDKTNPHFKNRYADIGIVLEVVKPTLNECDLMLIQPIVSRVVEGKSLNILQTKLIHASGESIDSEMTIPEERDPQKLGSLITYYRRYAVLSMLGLSTEDDDGNGGMPKPALPPTVSDFAFIRSQLAISRKTETELLTLLTGGAKKKIEDLNSAEVASAKNAIAEVIRKQGVAK